MEFLKYVFQAWKVMGFWFGSWETKSTVLKHGSVYFKSEDKTKTGLIYEQIYAGRYIVDSHEIVFLSK